MRSPVACISEHSGTIIDQNNDNDHEIDLSLMDSSGEGSKACGTKPSILNPQASNFISLSTTKLKPLADQCTPLLTDISFIETSSSFGSVYTDDEFYPPSESFNPLISADKDFLQKDILTLNVSDSKKNHVTLFPAITLNPLGLSIQ